MYTFCAASCSSLCAITLCLAALELSLPPELTGGTGLGSAGGVSFSFPLFFLSGMRSGAFANKATPKRRWRTHNLVHFHTIMEDLGLIPNCTYVSMF